MLEMGVSMSHVVNYVGSGRPLTLPLSHARLDVGNLKDGETVTAGLVLPRTDIWA